MPLARLAPRARALPLALLLIAAPCVRPASAQTPTASATTTSASPLDGLLVPRPREATAGAVIPLAGGVAVVAGADRDDAFAARDLVDALRARGVAAAASRAGAYRVELLRADAPRARQLLAARRLAYDTAMRAEGYVLIADRGGAQVIGASPAGVFYGAQTLKQLVTGGGRTATLQGAVVRDWPAMRWRGLHDDLSRGPVPTLEFQKKQIRTFAAYKLNAYSPYFEHTLEYAAIPLAGPPGGAMSRADVRELVDYARRYHVEVIPEQEAFGHLHHVLKHERYAALAETEHGHVLAPGQAGSMPLIRSMFVEMDSLFGGRFLHIGADETFELGRGQTAERVRGEGIGAVYLGFLAQIEAALRPLGRQLLFWGDVAMNHPDLVKTLPKDLVAVAWTYDPQPSFDKWITPFRQADMQTWVAPGVNNWNRVYPNYNNALGNIRGFVRDGQRLGATGMLNTTWDDDGEAIFAQTWGGVLFGAAAAWQPGDSDPDAFLRAYPRAFHGDTAGHVEAAERALMAAHDVIKSAGAGDASDFLFWVDPWSAEGRVQADRLRPVASRLRLHAEDAIEHVIRARRAGATREPEALDAIEMGARRLDFIGMKFQFADEIARMYARTYAMSRDTANARTVRWTDLADISGINGRMQDLRDGYTLTRELYESAWRRENRPYWMQNVLARYDMATQLWLARNDRMVQARQQWSRTRTLPSPEELGMPTVPPTAPAVGSR